MQPLTQRNAVVAIRVSSDKQFQEGDSPEAQREQLEQMDDLQLSNEEKTRIIREQLHEIDLLQASIQDEHDQVRNLLWDLMKTLLEEPSRHLPGAAAEKPIR